MDLDLVEELIDEAPVKKKRAKKSKVYFGIVTQNAIIEYNALDKRTEVQIGNLIKGKVDLFKESSPNVPEDILVDQALLQLKPEIDVINNSKEIKKTRLFNTHIYPAFDKLIENVINTWKFHRYDTTYDDLKLETITDLYNKINGYNPELGRAYSYFTIIARNYLINQSKQIYEDSKKTDLETVDVERNITLEINKSEYSEQLKDFLKAWCNWVEINLQQLFKSTRDQRVADALIELLKTSDEVSLYNKKLLYVLIRERANVDTQHITKVVKILRDMFFEQFNEYRSNGFIDRTKYI